MSDDTALAEWLASGAKVDRPAEELAAACYSAFARRFVEALTPVDDLGPTEELHQEAVARRVWDVHCELNRLGDIEYQGTWALLDAPTRRAIKAYVAMASRS